MVDLETINLLEQIMRVSAAAIATVVGVRSYIVSNKRAEEARGRELETRQAQIFMDQFETWRSPEFRKQWHKVRALEWRDYDEFAERYSEDKNVEALMAYTSVVTFFEEIGVLVRRTDRNEPRV